MMTTGISLVADREERGQVCEFSDTTGVDDWFLTLVYIAIINDSCKWRALILYLALFSDGGRWRGLSSIFLSQVTGKEEENCHPPCYFQGLTWPTKNGIHIATFHALQRWLPPISQFHEMDRNGSMSGKEEVQLLLFFRYGEFTCQNSIPLLQERIRIYNSAR